jgi:hypothetical protein
MKAKSNIIGGLVLAWLVAITGTGQGQETAVKGDSFSSINLTDTPVRAEPFSLTAEDVWSIRTLSDEQLTTLVNALAATPTIPMASLPRGGIVGTFWSLQNPNWPPLPFDSSGSTVWQMSDGGYLLNDVDFDYNAPTLQMRAMGMDVPFPGDGGTNSFTPDGASYIAPDYGTNLWIAQVAVSSGYLTGIGTNTLAAVQYEIQSRTNLLQSDWQSEGSILGSGLTNWTPLSVAQIGRTNLFIRLKSWASSDASGLPEWWELEYFGTTGINPNAQDLAGDGWSNWQKFKMGLNPNVFYTPPAPQGVTVNYNSANGNVSVSWQLSPGPVTGYTVEKDVDNWYSGETTQYFSVSGANAYPDNVSSGLLAPFDGGGDIVSYRVQAQYGGGSSSWSDSVPLEPSTISASFITGPQGSAYVTTSPLPSGTTALQMTLVDEAAWFDYLLWGIGSEPSNPTFDIPVSNPSQAQYLIPATNSVVPPAADGGSYFWYVQTVNTNGSLGEPYLTMFGSDAVAPPYSDGRAQLKQNLIFLLRAATVDSPFKYIEINTNNGDYYSFANPPNYVYAGFYQLDEIANGGPFYEENIGSFDAYWPFENNYRYRNFVLNSTNLDSSGRITTGAGGDYYYNLCWVWNLYPGDWVWEEYPGSLMLVDSPAFQFQPPTTNGATIPSLLATNNTRWMVSYALDSASSYLWKIGATNYAGMNGLFSNVRNWYGLPFLSANLSGTTTLNAGNTTTAEGYFYPETAQPLFQTAAYDFWSRSQVPGSSGFSTTNTSDVLIASVGNSITVNGYAKLAVLNGYSGVYGYLGQYFDHAYQIDSNGNVTTNTTGVLSPYGQFFATQPGPAALVTMPDVDPPYQRGTCTVSCVSLQLDKNHDGNMDLSFNGPDVTSTSSPYLMWANNNYDRLTLDKDDNNFYDDDVKVGDCPYTPNHDTPDCNYLDGAGHRVIPCARDLQDFTRLWICGVTSNLLAALPASSTITLNWGDVGNPNSGNPTIDLFAAADADGGIGYLTNSSTAASQVDSLYCPYIGRLGPGSNLQLNASSFANHWAGNHFIWCGVTNGTGQLTMSFKDGSGNVLGQASVWIQIVDIKQMYECWSVGDNPNRAPTNTAYIVSDGLVAGEMSFRYANPGTAGTPYILYVHGWNMEYWEKDRFAEAAFKRLYWQGYHGRFGVFRWPTGFDFTDSYWKALTDPRNYDNSEFQAWQSAVGLLNKLNDLNAEYPGHVYMLAHSMGNVVAGEALRLAGNNQVVNTYVASQAALPAHDYDATVTTPYLLQFTYTYPTEPLHTLLGNRNYGPDTPNIYGNRLTNNAAVSRRVNFYNQNDFALAAPRWCFDQITKPDNLFNGDYVYGGSPNDPAPWNHFGFATISGTNFFDIVNSVTDCHKVMAYAAESRSTALGATPGITNLANLDLTTVWPADTSEHNYADHFWHSAQFRGDCWQEWSYWNTLLRNSQGFNISNP